MWVRARKNAYASDSFEDRFVYEAPVHSNGGKPNAFGGGYTGVGEGSPRESLKEHPPPTPPMQSTSMFRRVARFLAACVFITAVAVVALGGSVPRNISAASAVVTEGPATAVSLDTSLAPSVTITPELAAYVNGLVSTALRDPVGRRDFALFQDGAAVITRLTYPTLSPRRRSPNHGAHPGPRNAPEAALRDDLRVGECWLVPGSSGQLGIGLGTFVVPTHVTIDHIPQEIAADIGQAPRKMVLWGLVEGDHNVALYRRLLERGEVLHAPGLGRERPPLHGNLQYVFLASFDYNIFASFHIQTFPISSVAIDEGFYFGVVVLEVVDNWGGRDTCVYRVRIHGNPVVL